MVGQERGHDRTVANRGRRWTVDSGVSVAELLVVVVLLGLVLAATYTFDGAVRRSVAASESMAEGTSTFGQPLEFMSRILMQARSVGTSGTVKAPDGTIITLSTEMAAQPGDFHIVIVTDRIPFDGSWEINYFHVDQDEPSVLSWDKWGYDTANTLIDDRHAYWQMSRAVNNRTLNLPVFEFYGKDRSVRLTDPALINSDLRFVKISLAVPTASGDWTTDSRFVTLRN